LPEVELGGATAIALALGDAHTCALLEEGQVRCWGGNDNGQLGRGDSATRKSPGAPAESVVDLGTGERARSIAAGTRHTCALLEDGSVKCWGLNGAGQLGLGDSAARGTRPGQMGDQLPRVDLIY
jgi:alpha-tubulin suppressor-like RCC1 family protein